MKRMPDIQTASIDDLHLDPTNPRLGRHEVEKKLGQDEILGQMADWALDELAVSFLESGFWPQEALVVVKESLDSKSPPVLVVVEGNRRLAALKMLQRVRRGLEKSGKWRGYVEGAQPGRLDELTVAPFIEMPDRRAVQAYLGFRHVTGIKEWSPAEKARFIAHLIEDEGLDYEQVRRRIGSKAPTVKQHYLAYRLLLQMDGEAASIDVSRVEDRFSVLYRAVRAPGFQKYLGLEIDAKPAQAAKPVPADRLERLPKVAAWLFGTDKRPPVLIDSRDLDDFGKILESENGIAYLERAPHPTLEIAKRAAGVSPAAVAEAIEQAAYKLEEALAVVHQIKAEAPARLAEAVKRVGKDALQLLTIFPAIEKELRPEVG